MCYVVSGVVVPQIIYLIKLITKVLNYARKNKYSRNRSALTYWEEDYPSQLELGKKKYGGPFSEEQVEDLKTIIRLTPILISIVGLFCAEETRWNSFSSLDSS